MTSPYAAHTSFVIIILCGLSLATDCPDGWLSYHSSCYWIARSHLLSFTEAQHYCQQHGGNLLQLETQVENNYIRDYLRGLKDEYHWLGLTDEKAEGVWEWYISNMQTTYTDWGPTEPNTHGGIEEDCAVFSYGYDYAWADVPCENKYEPICEIQSEEAVVG